RPTHAISCLICFKFLSPPLTDSRPFVESGCKDTTFFLTGKFIFGFFAQSNVKYWFCVIFFLIFFILTLLPWRFFGICIGCFVAFLPKNEKLAFLYKIFCFNGLFIIDIFAFWGGYKEFF
ncbi:MAG: hypothetical protein IJU90_00810, partial [Bacteroidales bacterium]|nr:hypothetical protein [Bacteroidales bacterium]